MPNISTTNKNAIYKYTGKFTTLYKNDDDPIVIDRLRIKSILIDYSYDRNNMPLIYANIAVTYEQLKKLKANMKTGTILVNIQKYIENSDMPGLKIDYINAECVYFLSSDIGKDKEQAINPDRTEDYGYIVTIGFIALDHINKNKTAINGVINSGSMSAALYYALKGHNLLLEPLENNDKLKQVFIPPMKSVSKVISYLDDLSTFYNTPYRFFMDFDCTYLISSSGKAVKKKSESTTTVRIKLVKEYTEGNMEGMLEDKENKMYVLNVSATYANLMKNSVTEKTYSSIKGINTSGNTSTVPIEEDGVDSGLYKPNSSNVRISNENTGLIENMKTAAMNNSVVLGIVKNKADGAVFTINKYYYVEADEVYGPEVSGVYILSSKKEVYMQEGEGLAMSVMLTFKRLYSQKQK